MRGYDYNKAFECIPEITGLTCKRRGRHWYASHRIDGQVHSRFDKLTISLMNNSILFLEQGGEVLSLPAWLVKYGGAADYKEAFQLIEKGSSSIVWSASNKVSYNTDMDVCYISNQEIQPYRNIPLDKCVLFTYLSSIYGRDRVKEVFYKYNVTSDFRGNTVFWYCDKQGRFTRDKRIRYLGNGKRDKAIMAYPEFQTKDGYTGKCYFGEHLLYNDAEIGVVESEKTALICALHYPDVIWIASGGSNNLRDVKEHWKLYADYDKAGQKWESDYPDQCQMWHEDQGMTIGEDIGDLLLRFGK